MNNTIGSNITKLRREKGMTQAELAEKLNVSVQAVSKWENDVSRPDLERIGELAAVLDSTAEAIISGEDTAAPAEIKNGDISKRLLVITVNVKGSDPADITLRLPAELLIKARVEGTLAKLIGGDYSEMIPDSVFEMLECGVVGPVATVNTEDTFVNLEVVSYDS